MTHAPQREERVARLYLDDFNTRRGESGDLLIVEAASGAGDMDKGGR